jgi:hypothetical protein
MEKAVYEWMNAYHFFPKRIENLYEIVHHYRCENKYKLANVFYQIAKNVLREKIDKDSYLFLHNDIYTFKLDYEYTIIAYYLDNKKIKDDVVSILNHSDDQSINHSLMQNLKFYENFLQPMKIIDLTNQCIFSLNEESVLFNSSSSCLLENEEKNGYLLNVRYVNYSINERGQYLNCEKLIKMIFI